MKPSPRTFVLTLEIVIWMWLDGRSPGAIHVPFVAGNKAVLRLFPFKGFVNVEVNH